MSKNTICHGLHFCLPRVPQTYLKINIEQTFAEAVKSLVIGKDDLSQVEVYSVVTISKAESIVS